MNELAGTSAAHGRRAAGGGARAATAPRSVRPSAGRGPSAGQGVVEYGLILGLSAVLAVLILVLFGDQVADVVQWIGRTVDAATGTG